MREKSKIERRAPARAGARIPDRKRAREKRPARRRDTIQYATEKLNTDGTAHSTHHHATRDTRAVPVSAHWRCTEALERSHTRGLCCVRITLSVHAPEGAGAIYTLGMEAALHAETPRRPQLEPALLVACS